MDKTQIQLSIITDLINEALEEEDGMLVRSVKLLEHLRFVANGTDYSVRVPKINLDKTEIAIATIISSDNNWAGIGLTVKDRFGTNEESAWVVPYAKIEKGILNTIYIVLTNYFGLINNPESVVEIIIDNEEVANLLKGSAECQDNQKKRDLILNLVRTLPVPVDLQWRPRRSTRAMLFASSLAEKALADQAE
jgi:hypothetical protein